MDASDLGPIHQPGMFNIEAYRAGRWNGGMNRSSRGEAIAVAAGWHEDDGLRYRVFDVDGKVIFDTDSISSAAAAVDFKHHSVLLNNVLWRMQERLGDIPEGATEVVGNPETIIERFFAAPVSMSGNAAYVSVPFSAGAALSGKYGDVLAPFVCLMARELHANSGKGDRPEWLSMSADRALLEIYYHVAKLQKSVRNEDAGLIAENAADVANMAMMLLDVCGGIAATAIAQDRAAGEA